LVDVVRVDQWLARVVGEQVFRESGNDLLWVATCFEGLQRFRAVLPPSGKVGVHVLDEGGEVWMLVDGGFDVRFRDGQIQEAGSVWLNESLAKLWANVPITVKCVDIRNRNAAV